MKGKIGRPLLGERKLVHREVTTDPEIEEFLRKNPGINASEVFRNAVRSMMPKDVDTVRLQKMAQEISEMRAALAIKEAEYESLKRKVEDRERIQLDLRLEQDCHAWYLRSVVQAGVFKVRQSEAVDPVKAVQDYIVDGTIKSSEVEIREGKAILTARASSQTRRRLRNFIHGLSDVLEPIPGSSWIIPTEDVLREQYSLSMDMKAFQQAFLENPNMGDLPLDYFKRFRPAIVSEKTKGEIKKRMEAEYRTILIEVSKK